MEDTPSLPSSGEDLSLTIEVVPVEDEDDDLNTLAAAGKVYTDIQRDATLLEDYTVSSLATSERGLDIIMLVALAGASITAYKDLLTSIFNMITAAIDMLAKRDHVQEIEIIADGKTLILRDLHKRTAKELIDAFEREHPGATTSFTARTNVQVKAKVSQAKKSRTKHGQQQ